VVSEAIRTRLSTARVHFNNHHSYNNSIINFELDNGSIRTRREMLAGNGLVWLDEENYGEVVKTTTI